MIVTHPVGKIWQIGLIGCGNIGSRHLQALAKLTHPAHITAIDTHSKNQDIAAKRVAEISPGSHLTFEFSNDLSALPQESDLVLITTGAGPRRMLVETILAQKTVHNLILEKFLFQRAEDYAAIEALLQAENIPVWVNIPRRQFPAYQGLRNELAGTGPIFMSVEIGEPVGLATNGVHFVDLFAMLAGSTDGINLHGEALKPLYQGSRHKNSMEFEGVLYGSILDGSQLMIRRDLNSTAPITITINGQKLRASILENTSQAVIAREKSTGDTPAWSWQNLPFQMVFQSDLTHLAVADILTEGQCDLPDYIQSSAIHLACLAAYSKALGLEEGDICPIT